MNKLDIETSLRYLKRSTEKPIYYASRGGVGENFNIGLEFEEKRVTIYNARELQASPTLDHHGFALQNHKTGIVDFYQLNAQQSLYDSELGELIRSVTGARKVIVFDHTIRSDSASIRQQRNTREPANFIHNDYTPYSAQKRLKELLEPSEVKQHSRWAIINVWRSVRGVVLNSPIACCDASSVNPVDLVAVERRAHDRIGEIEFVTWNPGHRWYYFPHMQSSEVLLIKTFDSNDREHVTRTIHSAVQNPFANEATSPRESIESRILVLY